MTNDWLKTAESCYVAGYERHMWFALFQWAGALE